MDNIWYWKKPLTLNELLEQVENIDNEIPSPDAILILPLTNANGYVTDEDDDQVTMNNLPGSLLNSEAEPVFKATSYAIDDNEDNLDDSDDDVPLSRFMKYKKKCRNNDWVRQDITDTLPI
ncbi:piggyBac transposable element-derived protein 3-like [Anthonomus grandis grandis]|uniref:piggyBac transposable element-derived protein 3-like n=1 Tax=Anthonomus grandis grandis TaxID=2921223 RepID=UPI002166A30B|nr:piggyBac transposable element-derived protein 3-like [Anthonomus grandis grandis]